MPTPRLETRQTPTSLSDSDSHYGTAAKFGDNISSTTRRSSTIKNVEWRTLVEECGALSASSSTTERLWQEGLHAWNDRHAYYQGMQCFQQSLSPLLIAWRQREEQTDQQETATTDSSTSSGEKEAPPTNSMLRRLARRLLFCAYCELDNSTVNNNANDVFVAMERMIQCLHLLLFVLHGDDDESSSSFDIDDKQLWDDVWMELMLTMEETKYCQPLAKQVAQVGIQLSIHCQRIMKCCGWTHAMQRPGFMSPTLVLLQTSLPMLPFVPRGQRPDWCRVLEAQWESIRDELDMLLSETNNGAQHCWSKVGCGDRGSGMQDHRVVDGNGDWSECVLFGTGAAAVDYSNNNRVAPFTRRRLLQQLIPDAIDLAQGGGGEVIFSRLAPGTHIQPHCGPTNLRWTAHLGLKVPSKKKPIPVDDTFLGNLGDRRTISGFLLPMMTSSSQNQNTKHKKSQSIDECELLLPF